MGMEVEEDDAAVDAAAVLAAAGEAFEYVAADKGEGVAVVIVGVVAAVVVAQLRCLLCSWVAREGVVEAQMSWDTQVI